MRACLGLAGLLPLLACGAPASPPATPGSPPAAQAAPAPKAASPTASAADKEGFPHSALEIRSSNGRQWFNIRIADTEPRRELGLMYVTRLPYDEGMLFPEDQPQVMSMWMKNTYIPLDMLFIDVHGRIACVLANAKPESEQILTCDKPVKAVLEIAGGEAERRGIKVGDEVVHATFHR
jgi:uncharacterized membrane protein (UPF0127 family)